MRKDKNAHIRFHTAPPRVNQAPDDDDLNAPNELGHSASHLSEDLFSQNTFHLKLFKMFLKFSLKSSQFGFVQTRKSWRLVKIQTSDWRRLIWTKTVYFYSNKKVWWQTRKMTEMTLFKKSFSSFTINCFISAVSFSCLMNRWFHDANEAGLSSFFFMD